MTRVNEDAEEALWGDIPMLAALRLPIPAEGMDPLLNAMRIIYGEPIRLESRGAFLIVLQQESQ